MPEIDVAELSPVDLRKVWPDEAADFTPWLADNLDTLGKALRLDLELVETEAPTGSFTADIRATETSQDRGVIIENQLERTNHDHLGKVLTYAASHDVGVIVWISKEMRDEHREAFDWLNQRTGSDTEFYGVVVQAVSIDGSRPACLFDVAARPNETCKTIVDSGGRQPSKRSKWRKRFWRLVSGRLRDEYQLTRRRMSKPYFINIPAEIEGVEYHAFVGDKDTRAEFWLAGPDRARNEKLFDLLEARKSEIEDSFGEPLVWERKNPWGTAPWICVYWHNRIDYTDEAEALGRLADWMVERVVRFSQKLTPMVHELAAEIDNETPDAGVD